MSTALSLPVSTVKGVGPKTTEILHRAGIFTVRDLAYYLPRDYQDFQRVARIADLRPGEVFFRATAEAVSVSRKRHLTITEATLSDGSGKIRAVWFNQPYRAKQLDPPRKPSAPPPAFYFSGRLQFSFGRYQLTNPSVRLASAESSATAPTASTATAQTAQAQTTQTAPTATAPTAIAPTTAFQPVYRAIRGLDTRKIRALLADLRPTLATVPDLVPCLPGRADALLAVHFPESPANARAGRDYLATEELFCLILSAKLNKNAVSKLKAPAIPFQAEAFRRFVGNLPFKLTNAQRRATWEVVRDMTREAPMNRLLQGDVGSGKTLVAALAAFDATQAGFQTALMAPTEVLAAQHAESLAKLFGKQLRIALLTGSTKHKATLKAQVSAGAVDLVVGTHALLTDDTVFAKLGLAIIDEQHRFGVTQRQKLLNKSPLMPHLLSMTATPIPRSLQLTLFGDLDVSVLDELPAGRQTVTTRIVNRNALPRLWRDLEDELAKGHQAFYVCRKIDETADGPASVKAEATAIARRFRQYRTALLHGRMKPAEKEAVMTRFAKGEIDILVSTTVVEVGIDVPNATVMVIADADQYGLSQLHQLRGRVGRGSAPSFCYLLNSDDAPSRRLREVELSNDGFYLAEVDLKLRGPGEIYGSLQHGALDLRIAGVSDTKLIRRANALVTDFLRQGQNVLKYEELSSAIRKYQRLTTLN